MPYIHKNILGEIDELKKTMIEQKYLILNGGGTIMLSIANTKIRLNM